MLERIQGLHAKEGEVESTLLGTEQHKFVLECDYLETSCTFSIQLSYILAEELIPMERLMIEFWIHS